MRNVLDEVGLSSIRALFNGLEQSGQLLNVLNILEEKLSTELPLDTVERSLNLSRSISPADLLTRALLEKRRRPSMRLIRSKPSRFVATLESYLREEARSVYIAALLAKQLEAASYENSA
ncbi:MAG: hypothetical protein QXD24_04880 [Candidatus Caldarchaeum sp.]